MELHNIKTIILHNSVPFHYEIDFCEKIMESLGFEKEKTFFIFLKHEVNLSLYLDLYCGTRLLSFEMKEQKEQSTILFYFSIMIFQHCKKEKKNKPKWRKEKRFCTLCTVHAFLLFIFQCIFPIQCNVCYLVQWIITAEIKQSEI